MASPKMRLGDWGEGVARRFLTNAGYSVLETKWRCRWGEVDIVARQGQDLVFVEVRTRRGSQFGTPQESITSAKARRLTAAAQHYMEANGAAGVNWRIDLVSVLLDMRGRVKEVSHLEHAIEDPA